MSPLKLKDIKKSSLYVTPNLPVIQTKRYKFNLNSILSIFFGYTAFIIIIVVTLLALTPLKELIFILENEKLTLQSERIKELETEVILLSRTLNKISSSNRKLNFAMILAGTDSLDSTAAIYDSLKSVDDDERFGGSILIPLRKLLNKYICNDENPKFMIRPTSGIIINSFNIDQGHMGIDYGVKEGTPLYASMGGLVIFSGYKDDDGFMIMMQHDDNIITVYKHCSSLLKKNRDYISQGELIALSGGTGTNSKGDHLHFEVWENGKVIDPLKYLIN
ncbi:MAG: M23 family metallopeptidase [Bacteroidetes bacterium]|nr:M23 family metallopeptidase [Bacteroidota bacterium]